MIFLAAFAGAFLGAFAAYCFFVWLTSHHPKEIESLRAIKSSIDDEAKIQKIQEQLQL